MGTLKYSIVLEVTFLILVLLSLNASGQQVTRLGILNHEFRWTY
jgi:hypothetical protein